MYARTILPCVAVLVLATPGCDEDEGTSGVRRPPSFSRATELIPKERLQAPDICDELFAPADVAAASGMNPEGLKLKAGKRGCSITGDGRSLAVDLTLFPAKKSMRSAESLFELTTKNTTRAEAEAAMVATSERAHQRSPSSGVDRKAIAEIVEAMPPPHYVEVAGIGRRARMSTTPIQDDSSATLCEVHVLVRNAIFTVSASAEGLDEGATAAVAKSVAKTVEHKLSKM